MSHSAALTQQCAAAFAQTPRAIDEVWRKARAGAFDTPAPLQGLRGAGQDVAVDFALDVALTKGNAEQQRTARQEMQDARRKTLKEGRGWRAGADLGADAAAGLGAGAAIRLGAAAT